MTSKGPIRTFFSFLITDAKKDIDFLLAWCRGEVDTKKTLKKLNTLNFKKMLEDYWLWFLIILLAFCVGWFIASVYYEGLCNEFIYDAYIKPTLLSPSTPYSNVSIGLYS